MALYALREEDLPVLRAIHGDLFADDALFMAWLGGRQVVTIGDRVTLTVLRRGLVPALSVVDLVERRGPLQAHELALLRYDARELRCQNPQGTVTRSLWDAVEEGLRSPPARIVVEGEEDLAGIPVTALAPLGTAVAYGVPGRGLAAYVIDRAHRRAVLSLLRRAGGRLRAPRQHQGLDEGL